MKKKMMKENTILIFGMIWQSNINNNSNIIMIRKMKINQSLIFTMSLNKKILIKIKRINMKKMKKFQQKEKNKKNFFNDFMEFLMKMTRKMKLCSK